MYTLEEAWFVWKDKPGSEEWIEWVAWRLRKDINISLENALLDACDEALAWACDDELLLNAAGLSIETHERSRDAWRAWFADTSNPELHAEWVRHQGIANAAGRAYTRARSQCIEYILKATERMVE